MADFIFIRKSRNLASSLLYLVFNILLGVGSIIVTLITGSWIPGIFLVLLSKWRIFAVRPRYWGVNIKSSLVDLIVGSGIVLIAYCSGTTPLPVHYLLAVIYVLWLTLLKPRSSESAARAQALVAIFIGTTAATLMTASAEAIFLSLACFIVGYGAARHIIVQSDDRDFSLVTLSVGLVSAEIAWLAHSWLIVYRFGSTGIIVPQLSIILSIVAFVFGAAYRSAIKHDGKIRSADISMPLIFGTLLIAIIILWFSKPIFDV